MLEKERQIMKKLKDLVDKQRDEIRAKDHELASRNEDVEAVRAETKRNTNLTKHFGCLGWPFTTVAPDAAGSLDEGQPGPSTQDGSDGGSGESTDPAEGWAGSCSSGTAAGAGDTAAGGDQAEEGAPRLGTRERACWCHTALARRFWNTSGYVIWEGGKNIYRCKLRESVIEQNA